MTFKLFIPIFWEALLLRGLYWCNTIPSLEKRESDSVRSLLAFYIHTYIRTTVLIKEGIYASCHSGFTHCYLELACIHILIYIPKSSFPIKLSSSNPSQVKLENRAARESGNAIVIAQVERTLALILCLFSTAYKNSICLEEKEKRRQYSHKTRGHITGSSRHSRQLVGVFFFF